MPTTSPEHHELSLPARIANDAVAGLALGTLQISVAISLAALVFSGELSDGVSRAGIGYVFGTGVLVVLIGTWTRMDTVISGAQDSAAVVAAAIAAGIVADTAPAQRLPTTFVAIALSGLLAGVAFYAIGRARLGEVARSIPSTVVGGFMGGTGWLLLRGGVEVMVGRPLSWSDSDVLIEWSTARLWIPGVILALFMVVVLRSSLSSAAVGLAILATAAAIHIVGRVGWSLDRLEQNGWLIGPFPASRRWTPIGPSDLADTDWGAIAGQALPILGLVTVSVIGVLLNMTGLEIACEENVEIDVELEITGLANVVSSLGGGMIGYHLLGDTIIARQLEARGRVVPALIGALVVGVVVWGDTAVGMMPRAVAGGVLAAVGVSLLVSWAKQIRADLGRLDRVLSVGIVLVIATFGVLTGIVAGVMAATVVFVVSYSRLSPIRIVHRLSTAHSNVDRTAIERDVLRAHEDAVVALELDGFLFFGSLRRINDVVQPLIDEQSIEYLILDFREVRGIDASVVSGLAALERRAAEADVRLVWSHVRSELSDQLSGAAVHLRRHVETDLDHALEYVENELLAGVERATELDDELAAWLALIEPFGDRRELQPGQEVIHVGDAGGELFVVVSGQLTAWGDAASGERIRFRRVGAGSLLGEVSFSTGGVRTASVIADTASIVVCLSPSAIDEMLLVDPQLALQTSRLITTRLAERLAYTSRIVRTLNS